MMSRAFSAGWIVAGWLLAAPTVASTSWTPVGPPGGAIVSSIAVDSSNPSTIYAVMGSAGIYRSGNGGDNWKPANAGMEGVDVTALVLPPNRSATLYAGGTRVAPEGNVIGAGVFKTIDGGASWSLSNSGLQDLFVHALAIDAGNTSLLYAGTNRGVWKTIDGGATWEAANDGLEGADGIAPVSALAADPETPGVIYAATSDGFSYSLDAGARWLRAGEGLTNIFLNPVAVNPSLPSVLLAASSTAGVLSRSTDRGLHWASLSGGLPDAFLHAIAFDPSSPSVVYAGTDAGLYRSVDGGTSWSSVPGLANQIVLSFAFDSFDRSRLYAGTAIGFFQSGDGGTSWAYSNQGVARFSCVTAVGPEARGSLYAATQRGGVFRSADGGRTWAAGNLDWRYASIESLAVDPSSPSKVYAGGNGLWKTVDAGSTWLPAGSGLEALIVVSLAIDPADSSTLFAGTLEDIPNLPPGGGIFKSIDGGQSWSIASNGLKSCDDCVEPIVGALAIDPTRPSTIYAGAYFYGLPGPGVFKSADGGENWIRMNAGLGDTEVTALAIDPSTPSTLYAGTAGGVYRSTDGAASWTSAGLAGSLVVSLAVDPRKAPILYAATNGAGVFRSEDGGQNWESVNDGLGELSVKSLSLDLPGEALYAGTYSSGVFKLTLKEGVTSTRLPRALAPRRGL